MNVVAMNYSKYESYKDSGVGWLGEIPSDWKLGRISAFFSERRQKVSDKDYPPLSVTKLGVFPQWENVAKSNDGDNRKLVKKGDFVINSRSDRKGSSGIAKQDGSVSLINIVLKPVDIEPRYSEYLFKSYNFIEEFYRVGHGIVADLWTTRFDDIKNSMIALPSLDVQTKIANFLDEKTAQIDQAIALKQQQIDKLNEYKQIVIQNAVTKGLNPKAPMKNSGVEWIGDIPEHWEVKKLKFIFDKIQTGTTPISQINGYFDGEINWFTPKDLNNDYLLDSERKLTQLAIVHKQVKLFEKNSVLVVGIGATSGKTSFMPIEGAFNQQITAFKSYYDNNKFYYYLIQSLSSIMLSLANYTTLPILNNEFFKKLILVQPPLAEQDRIVEYLDEKMQKFNNAKIAYQIQIDRLKEYKNILINQAVTGKIKIDS